MQSWFRLQTNATSRCLEQVLATTTQVSMGLSHYSFCCQDKPQVKHFTVVSSSVGCLSWSSSCSELLPSGYPSEDSSSVVNMLVPSFLLSDPHTLQDAQDNFS